MRQPSLCLALACALGVPTLPALAQQPDEHAAQPTGASKQKTDKPKTAKQKNTIAKKGDPAQWYRDPQTEQARVQLQKQDIAAAYNESQAACKKLSTGRSKCLNQARATYRHDMANAPKLVAQGPHSETLERVTVQYTMEEPGASQVGASQSGTTQSGTPQPGTTQPNTPQPGTTQPGSPQPGLPRNDAAAPEVPHSGVTQPDQPHSHY
jgi:hypothetical protein